MWGGGAGSPQGGPEGHGPPAAGVCEGKSEMLHKRLGSFTHAVPPQPWGGTVLILLDLKIRKKTQSLWETSMNPVQQVTLGFPKHRPCPPHLQTPSPQYVAVVSEVCRRQPPPPQRVLDTPRQLSCKATDFACAGRGVGVGGGVPGTGVGIYEKKAPRRDPGSKDHKRAREDLCLFRRP